MLKPVLAIFFLMTCVAKSAAADEDHYDARAALEAGEILSLSAILAGLPARVSGVPIDVDLERDDGMWIYELEVRTNRGRLFEVEVDAATGRILELEEEEY